MMINKKRFVVTIVILVSTCAIIGRKVLARNDQFAYEDIMRLDKVVMKISESYVEEINSKVLVEAAVEGLRTILDPHTAYFSEKEYDNLKISTEGAFGGLGIQIAIRENVLTIISPLHGTPAFRMGLQAGDKIIQIDSVSTEGITIDKAVDKLRGKPGTQVTILIIREGAVEPLEYTVTRDIIRIKSVPFASLLDKSIGYIQITQFSQQTGKDLHENILKLRDQGLTSLILDLRNNPGGLLNQAISVSDFFLDKNQLIVYTKGRSRLQNKDYLSEYAPIWNKDHKLIVLVNEGSASASEIVAGAIQDHDRGLIMGKPTFGKGSVQTILPLDAEKYALKLTTAYYYTPSGRCINKPYNSAKVLKQKLSETDTAETKDTTKYFTDAGRLVQAGGGIIPDVEIEGTLFSRYIRELERKTMFFNFIVKKRKNIEREHNIDLKLKITDKLRSEFKNFLFSDSAFLEYKSAANIMFNEFSTTLTKERESLGDTLPSDLNAHVDSLKSEIEKLLKLQTKKQFDQNMAYIDFALKRELIQAVHGDSLRTVLELARDPQVQTAIAYLKDSDRYAKSIAKQKEKPKKK